MEKLSFGGQLSDSKYQEGRKSLGVDAVMEGCGNLSPIFSTKSKSYYLRVKMEEECWGFEERENRVI